MKKVSHITILYNNVTDLDFGEKSDILADEDTVITAKSIANVLEKLGYKIILFEVNQKNIAQLAKIKTDFFFNFCGGIGNLPNSEYLVPQYLDKIGIPYSGADGKHLLLTTNKWLTKKLFETNNIPTPAYQIFNTPEEKLKTSLKFPLIVKPMAQDCSFGVHNKSVVVSNLELKKQIKKVIEEYHGPALVEDYINTRELNVTVVGNGKQAKVLPISEIIFGKSYDNKKKWKIVDFAAKWLTNSKSYKDTVGTCPAVLSQEIKTKIEKLALKAYRKICGNPGYARLDIRLSENNKIYFLEINLNPDISDGMGAARSAKANGWSYGEFLNQIIWVSVNKAGK